MQAEQNAEQERLRAIQAELKLQQLRAKMRKLGIELED